LLIILRYTLVSLALVQCFAAHAIDITAFTGRTMGTTFNVRAVLPADADSTAIASAIDKRLVDVNQQMSHYIPDSEISTFNRNAKPGQWFEVSPPFAMVTSHALQLANDSGGAFDPTVSPLVNLWGFGPAERAPKPPSDEQINAALARVGFEKIEARLDPPAIRRLTDGVELNLSAIAKGYGVDAVCEVLDDADCESFMVEIGGEVRCQGMKPAGVPWQIGIESVAKQNKPQKQIISSVLPLVNQAVATSGDYRNYWEHEGHRYSHTLNPRTGKPVDHTLATVTVQANTCMQADGLATLLLVLGPQAGYDWAKEHDISATLVERTNTGFREQNTPAWDAAGTDELNSAANRPTDPLSPEANSSMWSYFLITAVVFAIAIAGMAIGVIVSNRRLRGSCGGLSNMRDKTGNPACELCTNPSPSCSGDPEEREAVASES